MSHNFLKDASTIDASEYTSMNIFCNYAAEKEQTEECSITSIPEGGVFSKNIIKSYFINVRIRSPQKNFKKGKNVIDEFLENTSLPIFFYPDSNDINGRSNENSMTIAATAFLASLNTLFWHFWWIIPIIIISLVILLIFGVRVCNHHSSTFYEFIFCYLFQLALYKYIMGVNEPDDPPLYPRSLQQA